MLNKYVSLFPIINLASKKCTDMFFLLFSSFTEKTAHNVEAEFVKMHITCYCVQHTDVTVAFEKMKKREREGRRNYIWPQILH